MIPSSSPSLPESKLRSVLGALKAERARRLRSVSDKFTRYAGKPLDFVEEALLGFLWSKQKLIIQSVQDNRKTAVPSCHDVGKSRIAGIAAAYWLSCYPPGEAFVVTLAPTGHQVRAILWREIARIHSEGGLPGYVTQTEWKIDMGEHVELVGYGRSPKDTNPTALQGIHQKRVLVILDEACGIAKTLWDAADSLVANEFSRMLAIGNPDDPSSEFANVCKPGSGYNVIPISAFESPNFTGEAIPEWLTHLLVSKIWEAECRKKWGENSPLYISKVLGRFPEQSKDGLLKLGDITAAMTRTLTPGLPNDLGVDVARFGNNNTVIYHRRGSVARRLVRYQGKDTMVTVGHIVKCLRETGAKRVKIDDTGVGGGVTDRLNELKRSPANQEEREIAALLRNVMIVPVNVGAAPTVLPEEPNRKKEERYAETEQFFNLRAQLNWAMRDRFSSGDIDLSTDKGPEGQDNEDLQAQAADMRYTLTSRGQIQMESKQDMEKRGRQSPDDWDALVLAFADAVGDPVADTWALLGKRP